MTYKYSAKANAFYPESILSSYSKLPDDLVSVDENTFNEYACKQPPCGKIRESNSLGFPVWVNAPKASDEEIIASNVSKKSRLLNSAMNSIKPLQYAVDLGISNDIDMKNLDILKRYAVEISRVDTSKVKPSWPKNPVE